MPISWCECKKLSACVMGWIFGATVCAPSPTTTRSLSRATFLFCSNSHNWYFFKVQHGGGRDAGLHLRIAAFDAFDPFPVSDFVPRIHRQVHRRSATLRQDFADPVRGEKGSISTPNGCDGGPAPLSHDTIFLNTRSHQRKESRSRLWLCNIFSKDEFSSFVSVLFLD